jgi:hypothetical protein
MLSGRRRLGREGGAEISITIDERRRDKEIY